MNSLVSRYILDMQTRSFKEIRQQYPHEDDFLVLVDCETRDLPTGEIEVTGAKYVHCFKTGSEMFNAYKDLSKKLDNVFFVTPMYKESLTMEKKFSMRVGHH